MAYCRSCGVGVMCKDQPRPDGSCKGICERRVDWQGRHLRAGKRYKSNNGMVS